MDDVALISEEDLAKRDFCKLKTIFNELTNKNINLKNSEEINKLNEDFRKNIDDFKQKYSLFNEYNSDILNYEKYILNGRKRACEQKLYDEPNNFNEIIEEWDYEVLLDNINKVEIIDKNSQSNSFVFKGYCNFEMEFKKCYIKSFFPDQKNLLYEQKIYRYIQNRNQNIKPYFEDYFVKTFAVVKILSSDFEKFIDANDRYMAENDLSDKYSLDNEKLNSGLRKYKYIYLIITEDTGGMTYKDFFIRYFDN